MDISRPRPRDRWDDEMDRYDRDKAQGDMAQGGKAQGGKEQGDMAQGGKEQGGKAQGDMAQGGKAEAKEKPSSLVVATMALDKIALDKMKVNGNLDAVDMNMQTLVKLKKFMMILLVTSIVIVVLNLVIYALFIYIEYKDVIKVVNDNAATTMGAPGGFATAVAIKFPVLSKLMGFISSSYPLAVFFCMRDPTINAIFSQDIANNLANMWSLEQSGGQCALITGSTPIGVPPASVLICCGVTNAYNLQLCEAPCNADDSTSTPSIVANCLSSAMNGAQMGEDMCGPPCALGMAIVNVGITLGITYGTKALNPSPPCIQ